MAERLSSNARKYLKRRVAEDRKLQAAEQKRAFKAERLASFQPTIAPTRESYAQRRLRGVEEALKSDKLGNIQHVELLLQRIWCKSKLGMIDRSERDSELLEFMNQHLEKDDSLESHFLDPIEDEQGRVTNRMALIRDEIMAGPK